MLAASTAFMLRAPMKPRAVGVFAETISGNLSTTELLRRRLCLAEAGEWKRLWADCEADTTTGGRDDSGRLEAASDSADTTRIFGSAMRKATGGCIQSAKRILTGQKVREPTAAVGQ